MTLPPIETLLPWSAPELVQTKMGPRVRRHAHASPQYQNLYATDVAGFRAAGLTYGSKDGILTAFWWSVPLQEPVKAQNGFRTSANVTLRGYQEGAIEAGVRFLLEPKSENGIEILPTGSGKSLVAGGIAQRLPGPCLILQPSKEILEQNEAKLIGYGYHPALYSASVGSKQIGDITLATIGSVVKRKDLFKEFEFCIVDEVHLVNSKKEDGMYRTFFEDTPMKILGLTATPYRLASNSFGSELRFLTRTRPKIFSRVLYYVQNKTLFDNGYLCPLEYREIKGLRKERMTLNSTGADFTDKSVVAEMELIHFPDLLEDTVGNLISEGRKSILVFTRFTKEAAQLASRFSGAEIVTAETAPRERERIIGAFKAGKIPMLANVGVLAIGFDYPALDTVVLAGPTMSLAQYYQKVGRALRPAPGKKSALIVDMVGMVERFGRIEDLTIHEGPHGKWWVGSGDKPLTNVIFGTPHGRPDYLPQKQATETPPMLAF